MKNIIKRGTSLLLVLAMLLSFAAVVGAEEPTTTTPEKILTLTVENKLLRAGQTEYLAVYEEVAKGYKITGLTISATSTNSKVVVKGVYPWIPKSYLDNGQWDYDYDAKETVFTSRSVGGDPLAAPPTADPLLVWTSTGGFQTSDKPLCFIAVEAQEDVTPGAYQINICRNPHPEKPDDHFLFAYRDPATNKDLGQTEENAILNPGTAVVIPVDATLPTVILTKTAFEAPTQAGLAVGGEAAGDYDLTKYVKLVTEEGLVDVTSLSVMVNGDKSVSLKQGNVLSLATTAEKDKGYKLTVTAANGKQLAAAVELPFTVSKQDSAFTMAGFTKNGGYSMDFAGPYEAPAYSGTTANKFVPLDPKAYDQYGMPMGKATTELKLYSDAACTKEITSGNAFESVTVSESTGSVQISKNLQADVWCKVRASAAIEGVTKTSDWITFQIKSNYPQPRKAILSLTDGSGNPFSGDAAKGTFDIPGGSGETTIKFAVDHFIDQFGHTMDTNTTPKSYTVTFTVPTTTTVPGVECTSNGTSGTITVKSTAASYAPITGTFEVVSEGTSIDAYLTDTTTPATLTIKKADPIASSLASMENGVSGYQKDKIFPVGSFPTELPGIDEEKTVELVPLCVLDQYDAVMQTGVAAANYKLYKVDGETKTPISADYAKFEDGSEGRVTLKLTNALVGEEGAKSLALTAGNYQIEATYNNKTATASFAMAEGEAELSGTPIYYDVETGNKPTLYVPYKYGTLDSGKMTTMRVGAAITTQYGKPYGGSELPVYALSDVKLNEETIENKAITWTAEADGTGVTFTVDKSAAQLFGTSNTATLTAEMTVTVGEKSTQSIPISITIKKEASVLSAVKVEMAEDTAFTTGLRTWSANRTSESKEGEVTLLSPNAKKTWYIRRTAEDQYGVEMDIQGLVTATGCSWSYDTDKATGKILYFKLGVPAGHKDSFVLRLPNINPEYKFTAKFVPMEFVKSETGKNDTFQLSDYLNRTANEDGTFSAEYNGQPWSTILAKKDGAKVYIKTAEGENNTEIPSDKLTLEVTKDGTPVGMDAKANAGSYQVKLVYTDAEGQTYTVDEKTFTITPKTVKITANRAITKEYDGTANLPDVTLAVTADETLNVDKSVLKFAQENVGTDINVELTSADANCLKTASDEPATNYTADLSKLKGTITARQLTVTPNEKTFTYGQDTEINAALEREYTVSNNLEGEKAAKITGSMKLTTTSGADVTVYNAGTYNVVLGNLSLTGTSAGNYQLELASGTHTWTISKKSVDAFNVTLEADFGVYGSELYAMMKAAKVTVDGQEVNLNTLYNVDVPSIENVANTAVAVNAGEYTVTGLTLTTLGTANYTFTTAPTLKINVKPHVLTDADVQLSGETSAGFDGTKKIVTVTVSFTYNGRPVTLTKDTDYTITGEVEASNAGGHFLEVLAVPNGNLSGSVQKRWQIWSYEIQPGDLTFKLKSGVTFTYDTTPKKLQKSNVTWDVTATDAKRKAFLKKYFTEDDFNLDCLEQTDAGDYTASASMRHNFTKSKTSGAFNMNVSWTIGKSSEKPISDQTASTKYGQPGSLTVTLSEGQYKGLTNGAWTMRDIGGIFESAVAEYKDGVVTINWKLKDTTKAGDTGSFKVTVPASTNYEGYEFTVTVNVTAKDAQTGFGFTYANPIVGYAEDTYTNPVQNAKTTPAYTSSNQNVATVASNGVVTILDVGTTIITANAPENGEYASATASYTLTVVASPLTVTASSATMTANDSVPSFTASVTGLKRGQTTAQVFQTLTASAATDGKTAGTYAVNASATLKTDFVPRYTLRFVPGTLTVNPAQTAIDVVLPIIIGGNTCANGYANCACESFYDLDASRWYHEAIDWAYSLGLMNGTTKSTFGPNAAATRAQTWTMLARIAGQDTRRSSTWYEVGQKWAMNLGITDGTNPMGSLTREQLAAMLYRYVGSPAVNGTLTFTDSANVSAWARNAMIWAVQNGILDGVGGNRLNPKGTTTRAQAAAIFMRFSKLINK